MESIQRIHDRKPGGQIFTYIVEYEEGDLIYGLASGRALYVEAIMSVHSVEKMPRVIMVDDMNNQFLGTNAPTTPNQRALGADGAGPDLNSETKNMSREGALFHAFLRDKVKPKWSPQNNRGADNVNQRIKSASKAGLLWTTTERKKRIHFILDGLDMALVTGKLDYLAMRMGERKLEDPTNKSVTGCELRWLYRNRLNREVMDRVVFWENEQKLRDPPWEDLRWRDLWSNYKPKSEQDSALVSWLKRMF